MKMKGKGSVDSPTMSKVYHDKSVGLVDQVKSMDREDTVTPMSSTGENKPKKGPVFKP